MELSDGTSGGTIYFIYARFIRYLGDTAASSKYNKFTVTTSKSRFPDSLNCLDNFMRKNTAPKIADTVPMRTVDG